MLGSGYYGNQYNSIDSQLGWKVTVNRGQDISDLGGGRPNVEDLFGPFVQCILGSIYDTWEQENEVEVVIEMVSVLPCIFNLHACACISYWIELLWRINPNVTIFKTIIWEAGTTSQCITKSISRKEIMQDQATEIQISLVTLYHHSDTFTLPCLFISYSFTDVKIFC